MATNYDLKNTGQEVQERLDQVPVTQQDLAAEIQRAELAEQTLDGKIDNEALRAQGAEQTLDGKIDAEEERAKAAEKTNADDIDAIEEKIPSGASSANKLATEGYVNDKVATDSATFRGTFNLVSDLGLVPTATHSQIAYSLGGEVSTADNNDYAFVQIPTSFETPTEIAKIERYKFNGETWTFEYDLNNSGFTAAQWSAINSGITSNDVTKLAALPTNAELTTLLNGKQDTLTFDNVPTQGSNNPVKSGGVYAGIKTEEERAKAAEKMNADDIDALEEKVPSDASASNKLATESYVANSVAGIQSDLTAETGRAELAEQTLDGKIDAEEERAKAAEKQNADDIDAIEEKIPSSASSANKLATEGYVNDKVATDSATFRGTFNLVSDLGLVPTATHSQIAYLLGGEISTANNNDYAFVQIPTSIETPTEIAKIERYKFNGETWAFEYDLNNSVFTAAQWSAINSGITEEFVAKLSALPTNADLSEALGVLTDGIAAINEKIPSGASSENMLATQSDVAAVASNLQDQINEIVSKDTTVSLAATPSAIFVATPTSIVLTASTNTAASAITIKRAGTTIAQGSGNTLTHTDAAVTLNAPGSVAYSADFTISGLHRSTNKSVTAVYPVFYGAQANFDAASLAQYATPTTSVARAYTVQLDSTRRKFYIRVPKQGVAQVKSVVMGSGSEASPVSGGIVAALSGENYNVWASDDGFTGDGPQVFTVS